MNSLEPVLHYHQATKHHFHRFARSLGYLDWANQPNPFRRYEGAPLISLPRLTANEQPASPPYENLYRAGAVPSQPVTQQALSRFFEYALSLTAWKQAGESSWALRSNPSSGNLHPTEGYVLTGPVSGLAQTSGLYHYAPKEHGLERRTDWSDASFARLLQPFPQGTFLFGLSSVHWREAWKYGERAFRYCQHDVGHAIGTARIAAAALGWRAVLLDGSSDDQITALLGLDRPQDFDGAEREHPDCLMAVWPGEPPISSMAGIPLCLDSESLRVPTGCTWYGKANRLSHDEPVSWAIIDEVATASWKTTVEPGLLALPAIVAEGGPCTGNPYDPSRLSAGQIIRQRRSAVAFDGKTAMPAATFFTMLSRVMPLAQGPVLQRPVPWDCLPWEPTIHLLLFVHRVEGIASGLYCLVRDQAKTDWLRQVMHDSFTWTKPQGCPNALPLFLLQEGDARRLAAQVSCGQEIAGDSAYSLGMVAEFDSSLHRHGPWFYRRLFWETGLIGQVLYLEAEAAGLRATGIGCYFDDPVHQTFGIKDQALQSLYHFTVGGPVEDSRLTTLPPYGPQTQ
ncbi:MAG: SagB/ThcOx family dehydrogenase [Nitrospirae bacterium]|nr:MAG: SagB/ThcOx family dehydrogenase [Nitrospirota bacterium]